VEGGGGDVPEGVCVDREIRMRAGVMSNSSCVLEFRMRAFPRNGEDVEKLSDQINTSNKQCKSNAP
jgi:hypothetical protein